jgi:hypothetical protein
MSIRKRSSKRRGVFGIIIKIKPHLFRLGCP